MELKTRKRLKGSAAKKRPRWDRPKHLIRLLRMLEMLRNRRGVTPERLAEEFGIDTRTVYRDLQSLRDCGADFHFDRESRSYSFVQAGLFLPPVNLTLPESLGLCAAAGAVARQKAGPLARDTAAALDKVKQSLAEQSRHKLDQLEKRIWVGLKELDAEEISGEVLEQLNNALRDQITLEMTYKPPARKLPTVRNVNPYGLFYKNGAWYMLGYCHLRKGNRIFRLNRIKKLRLTARRFTTPPDFSVEQYLGKSWDLFDGKETLVQVRFRRQVAPYITEAKWHPTQKLRKEGDGSVTLTVVVSGTEEIKRWILSWGEFAEVLKPARLRKHLAATTSALARIYAPAS